mmetsp:Transcript_24261/g.67198  ORF Transcript_24261/g.67198 Transcript_24261/m.67198 type:complete len:217 (-) Transcript_24261:1227-1877(-)
MTNGRTIALVPIISFLLPSAAFVVPTNRRRVVGYHILSSSAQKEESTSIYDGKRTSQSEKETNQTHGLEPATSKLQQRIETALSPATEFLDDVSGGWALSYADLTPNSEKTPVGQIFLATNAAYAIVGLFLSLRGEVLLGLLTDICSVASFGYHFTQLQQPYGRTQDSTVKLALLIDYFFAVTAILVGLSYLAIDQTLPPAEGIVTSILGIACLLR